MRKKLLIAGAVVVGIVIIAAVSVQPIMMALTKRHSPFEEVAFAHDDLAITVGYSRPYAKGREIFGGLVPYGEVWRTGANEATTFTVNRDVRVDGQPLPAGRYALFTIPGPDMWTFIFNSAAEQWGAFEYDESKDVVRVPAKVVRIASPGAEQFLINFTEWEEGKTHLMLSWDTVSVSVPIALDDAGNATDAETEGQDE